jgi:hypothetical protein
MALQSMTALASITLQEASASVSFSGIPQNYRDLILIVNATIPTEGVPRLRINGDAGNNYSYLAIYANGGAQSFGANNESFIRLGHTGTGFSGNQFMCVAQFMDYSAVDKQKTVISRNNDDSVRALSATASRWASTTAINSITCIMSQNTYAAGATFNLYGRIA